MTRHSAKKQENAKWKIVERIVKLLEQSLSPDAKVESNVMLPVLTSNIGAKRQCDVVIWAGKPPRETITIVEVQDRKKNVDVNMFDGWCTKMVEVGAQHLICVSKKGFSARVKEKAQQRGPTIRLVKLEELERIQWPIGLTGNNMVYFQTILQGTDIKLLPKKGGEKIPGPLNHTIDDLVFQYEGQEFTFCVRDFINKHLLERNLTDGVHKFFFSWPDNDQNGLYIANNLRISLFVIVSGTVEIKRYKIPLSISSYKQVEQIDIESPIAWLMEAIGTIESKETDIRITFLSDDKGFLRPARISYPGSRATIKLPFSLQFPSD